LLPLGKNIVAQQSGNLIPGKNFPFPVMVQSFGSRKADAIAVRIGCQCQIGSDLLGPLDEGVKNDSILGIRDVTGHVRKIAVR